MDAPPRHPARSAAVLLMTVSALAGTAACVFGAFQWGLLGLGVGLVGAWGLFLLGLFALYQRHHHAEAAVADTPPVIMTPPGAVQPDRVPPV